MRRRLTSLRACLSGRTETELDPDRVRLKRLDFRRTRAFFAPHVFALGGDVPDPPPTSLVEVEVWRHAMDLPTDVALRTSSYGGATIGRMAALSSAWLFSLPDPGRSTVEEALLPAYEEFEALIFNAIHGCYRQAAGCLRNAFELMTHAAAFVATGNQQGLEDWRDGLIEPTVGNSRAEIFRSPLGVQIEALVAPASIFSSVSTAWSKRLYRRLCGYAHSRSGYQNADFWESNGPVWVPRALETIERELSETLLYSAVCLRLGDKTWTPPAEITVLTSAPPASIADIAGGVLAYLS